MINVVNAIDNSTEEFLYRGEDCMDVFTNKLIEVKDKIMAKMEENKEPIKTAKNLEDFKNATHCFICGEKFEKDDVRCYDNCHFTGKYRGCAHQKCNLDYSMRRYKIPVFFHNLKNYDAHLVIEKANDLSENSRIDVIAQNTEKFVTFGFKRLSFKDSFSFLTASLDKLVGLTKYENYDPKKAKEELTMSDEWDKRFKFSKRNPYVDDLDDLDLLTDKGVYPYDYFEQLPPKKAFYSKLTETNISDDEYERAKKIWKHFGIKNLGEYHDLYSRTDVLLLTDIFENFRDLCLEYYKLDPAHYVTLPNFAWDAMLLKTDIEIHPLTDQSMY
jgi:predicted nucleic acid-binding Zn ribbon protein